MALDTLTQHGYWLALQDLPLEAVQHACVAVLQTETFMPVPAILRQHALDFLKQCRQVDKEEAHRAEARQLREDLLNYQEVQALLAQVWPEERDRRLKDPIPPYETGEGQGS